jgi:hypothetical protein
MYFSDILPLMLLFNCCDDRLLVSFVLMLPNRVTYGLVILLCKYDSLTLAGRLFGLEKFPRVGERERERKYESV